MKCIKDKHKGRDCGPAKRKRSEAKACESAPPGV